MIQFLAQTGPRETTHFVLISRGNIERMLQDQPLRITPQSAQNQVIIAAESYVEGVLKLSAEVVERVVWEVVPELAEAMIREELHRLVGD